MVHDVDLVLDAVGGPAASRFLETIKRVGAIFLAFPLGFSGGEEAASLGVTVSATQVQSSGAQLEEIGRLLDAGTLRVIIDSTFALAEARKAHNAPSTGTSRASSYSQSPNRKSSRREHPEMIVLMGYIHLEPSDVEEFLADLETMAARTRAERGCLFYAFALENAPSGRMLLVQRWLDQDAFTAHLAGPNAASFQQEGANRTKSTFNNMRSSTNSPCPAKQRAVSS